MNHAVIHPSGRCFAAFKSVRFCPTLLSSELPEVTCRSFNLMPGSSLLSHGETPHYHRRYGVSLLSSAWGQVGPPRYSRQANSLCRNESFTSCRVAIAQPHRSHTSVCSFTPSRLRLVTPQNLSFPQILYPVNNAENLSRLSTKTPLAL